MTDTAKLQTLAANQRIERKLAIRRDVNAWIAANYLRVPTSALAVRLTQASGEVILPREIHAWMAQAVTGEMPASLDAAFIAVTGGAALKAHIRQAVLGESR